VHRRDADLDFPLCTCICDLCVHCRTAALHILPGDLDDTAESQLVREHQVRIDVNYATLVLNVRASPTRLRSSSCFWRVTLLHF
jgi:hypothetical protein